MLATTPPVESNSHDTLRPVPSTGARFQRADEARHDTIVGQSPGLRYVLSRLEMVAETDATVLLLGETGTGKELFANALHRRSRRRDRPYVIVNCATLPPALIESELFGRERGAFTGAHATQAGRFELAHGGTLLLDEVGELPLELQPKLLRVLQSGRLERLGSPRTIDVDVRVVASTNRDLLEEVKEGRFRRDLYYRLNVFPITVPSLRDRREDIGPLVKHLVDRHAKALRKRIDVIPDGVIRTLETCDWPGNVRELENVLQRAIILSPGTTLELKDVWVPTTEQSPVLSATLVDVERRHILQTLERCRWRIEGAGGAAQVLAMKSSTLRSRMLKLGIARPS